MYLIVKLSQKEFILNLFVMKDKIPDILFIHILHSCSNNKRIKNKLNENIRCFLLIKRIVLTGHNFFIFLF